MPSTNLSAVALTPESPETPAVVSDFIPSLQDLPTVPNIDYTNLNPTIFGQPFPDIDFNFEDIDLTNIQNIYYIMHDARVHCTWRQENLPLMSAYAFKNYLKNIKKMIFVSKWQKENYLKNIEHVTERMKKHNSKPETKERVRKNWKKR